jgi:hypothetical protein
MVLCMFIFLRLCEVARFSVREHNSVGRSDKLSVVVKPEGSAEIDVHH